VYRDEIRNVPAQRVAEVAGSAEMDAAEDAGVGDLCCLDVPVFDSIGSEDRFRDLLQRTGLSKSGTTWER
jgi:hypothetical protein